MLTTIKLAGPLQEAFFEKLESKNQLKTVYIYDARVTKSEIDSLKKLPKLESLRIYRCTLDEGVVDEIATLTNLELLSLGYGNISDGDVVKLKPLNNLRWLNLSGTQITDRGLKALADLKLGTIYLSDTAVTSEGVRHLEIPSVYAWNCGIREADLGEVKFRFNER